MTMHLCKPHINNIGNHKKKPSAKLLKARHEHDQYLRKIGLHADQLAAKARPARKFTATAKPQATGPACSNGFAPGGAKKTVFDSEWRRDYDHDPALAQRERAAVQRAKQKTTKIAPAYSKGAYQFITDDSDLTTLGRKV